MNPLIKGGNWSGGSANMVCCVIKVRVFVQQGPVPRVLIIQFSGEMCPLTPVGSNSLIVSPGTGHCVCVYLSLCQICVCFPLFIMCALVYTTQYFACMFVKAYMITTCHTATNQCFSINATHQRLKLCPCQCT